MNLRWKADSEYNFFSPNPTFPIWVFFHEVMHQLFKNSTCMTVSLCIWASKTFSGPLNYEIGIWWQISVIPVKFYQMKRNKGCRTTKLIHRLKKEKTSKLGSFSSEKLTPVRPRYNLVGSWYRSTLFFFHQSLPFPDLSIFSRSNAISFSSKNFQPLVWPSKPDRAKNLLVTLNYEIEIWWSISGHSG